MCNHRTVGFWGRFWTWFARVVVGVFVTAETIGLVTVGDEATLSFDLQTKAGTTAVPCRHTITGRFVIVAFCVWLAAHLGWGRFGIGWLVRRIHCTP
jgi:hypothetical protein